ncbi:MAG: hypothetical protein JXN10_09920 [Clostridia bacterium]|nr:hypothetical protein [Clostridia bacterium]
MKVTHLKLTSRKQDDDGRFSYHYLARIKLNLLLSSHYNCILTTTEGDLSEEQLKLNMSKLDVRAFIAYELQNPTQQFWLTPDFEKTELGKLFATKFERTDFLLYGKAKYWKHLPFNNE